jgi:hypothetical protein
MNDQIKSITDACLEMINQQWKRKQELQLFDRAVEVGDLYEFNLELPEFVLWAVVRRHKSNPDQLYVVPADQNPLAGSTDALTEETGRDLTLRCGLGLWLSQELVAEGQLVGILDDSAIREAQMRLSDLVSGKVTALPDQSDTDFLPEYEQWIDRMALAPSILAELFQLVVLPSTQRKTLVFASPPRALAAHGSDDLVEALENAGPRLLVSEILCGGLGTLIAVRRNDQVELRFLPRTGIQEPPQLEVVRNNMREPITWSQDGHVFVTQLLVPTVVVWPKHGVEFEISSPPESDA